MGFVGEYTVKLTTVLILRDQFVNRCTVDLIRTTEIVETRIIVLVVRGSQLFLNLRLTRLIQVNVGFEQVTHFQHCPMIKRIPVPVADFPECLVQFVKESCIVGQVFFENGKLLLHYDIQPAGLEEGLRNLRQAYHLVDQREFANILTNMTLQRETVSACLFLGRCRNLSIGGLDNNSIVVLNAENAFLTPAFQLHNENPFSGHEDADVKFSTINLTIPIYDVRIIEVLLSLVDE